MQINQAAEATVGTAVFRMGSTTGLRDGQVTGLDATVNFQSETSPNGVDTVTGLIQTDVCAEPGDSGGSLFTQDGNAPSASPPAAAATAPAAARPSSSRSPPPSRPPARHSATAAPAATGG